MNSRPENPESPYSSAEEWRPEHSPWLIAPAVMLATFMEVLDTSVANVSLPHIAGDLSAGLDESTWVLTSYLVSNAIFLPLSGWFSTLFGRKRFYMVCVAVFTVSSLLSGLAPNLSMLVLARILQGAGGGALQPISQAILVESFPRKKRGMAMAVYGMGVVFAPIIGPTLGGWITDNFNWRWIFLINIPVGVLSLLMTSWLVSDPPYLVRRRPGEDFQIDCVGLGFLGVGLGFLQVVLDTGQRDDWFSSPSITRYSILAAVGLAGMVVWELRQKRPIVDLRLLKDRNFALATCTMFMLGVMLYGSTVLLPIFLQTLMGYTAMLSGMVISPGGIVVVFVMPVVGWLLGLFEARWLVMWGILMNSLALVLMSRFNLNVDFTTAASVRVLQGFGLAFLFVPINTTAFSFISKEKTNQAAGLINLARNIGGSVGISWVTTLLERRTQFHHSVLASHITPYDFPYRDAVREATHMLMLRGANASQALIESQALLARLLYRQARMLAFIDCFWLLGVVFLAILPLMFFTKKTHPR